MKITGISVQVRDSNRVNVSVDGKYRFSLDVFQVGDLGLRIGKEYSEEELQALEVESQFGRMYARALEYSMVRPRSVKEMRDYLWRKTLSRKVKTKTGEVVERPGVSQEVTDRVLERLVDRGYVDDEKFTQFWVEYRHARKGTSLRRLKLELAQKGVARETVDRIVSESERNDKSELEKIIAKKQARYPDRQKFIQYLMRQGFSYDDVVSAVDAAESGAA